MMEQIIRYDCRWSDQVDLDFIRDFCMVEKNVFENEYSRTFFEKKYVKNPYGPSIVVVVYIDGMPAAARALWRNDVNGKESYQPCDTCVMETCRGKGVFSEMTRKSMEMLPKDCLVYNYPNANSRNGYIKLGWTVKNKYRDCLMLTVKQYLEKHPDMMDDQYFDWWIDQKTHFAKKIGGKYFLVTMNPQRTFLHFVRAQISEKAAKKLRHVGWGVNFYKDNRVTFYNRSMPEFWIVTKTDTTSRIPVWKMDVL